MKNNLNIVAIVQARMGSTRLPGKVMKTILDKHVILWDIDRVSLSKLIDEIVVAIPFGKQDDVIADTIEEYNNKILPLIDPVVVDHVIEQFLNNDCDYCSNSLQRTYPRGLDTEVFSFDALSKAWNESKKNYEREHVTPYIIENPNKFKLLNVSNNIDLSHLRWTLDTKEDFEFIDAVYQRIYPEKQMFFMDDVLDLLDKEPGLIDINKHIEQKKAH
jgi:spore coat polysaccharide biosynthesis protein SpsF (cytidylyltransferase family)